MLQNFFWPRHYRTQDANKYYFQQDGATAHRAKVVTSWLSDKFKDRLIDSKLWPPRSPDLTPYDFWLWGYLKSRVYNPIPSNLDELKRNIEREIKKINETDLEAVFFEFEKRCVSVLDLKGGHVEHI